MQCKTLRDAAAEGIADKVDAIELHGSEKIIKGVCESLASRIVGLQGVGEDISRRIQATT
jgi:hypothetical protein